MQDVVRDIRHAVRVFVAAPTLAIVAILTLGLGIGANTAIFSVINGLLLRPLPYPNPDQLLFVDGVLSRPDREISFQLSYPDVQDIRAEATTLGGVAPWTNGWGVTLEDADGADRLEANFVGRDYFSILGATPLQGRVFEPEDHGFGEEASLVAILSESTWRNRFGSDPNMIGRSVRLQNRAFTIVGIMPATFHDAAATQGGRTEVWAPLERAPELFGLLDLRNRGSRLMWAVARLNDGATIEAASAELRRLGAQVAAANPASNTDFSYRSAALASSFFVDARRPLWFLLGGSLFVLLIGCANVANLLLVRSAARTGEVTIRLALGASRGRIVRLVLVESAALALAGGFAGILLAVWLTPVLVRLSGITLPAFSNPGVDLPVLVVSVVTSLVCGVLAGVVPAWRVTRLNARDTIAGSGGGRVVRSSRTAGWLAGVEVTAAFVLAAGALLMLHSFSALTQTDLQLRADRLLTVRLELPHDRYDTPARRALAGQQLLDHLRALPGVEHAMIWGPSMFARSTWVAFLTPSERLGSADHERLMVWRHSTNPGALSDLGIQIRAGRDLAATDTLDTPAVAVISEAAAARLWPGQNAVGRQVQIGSGGNAAMVAIVGVAADARHRGRFRFSRGAAAYEPQLDLYLPYAQRPNSLVTLGIRTHNDAGAYATAVRAALASFDPTVPVYDVDVLENRLRAEAAPVGFAALLLNLYGGLAILLAGLGVYGVLASGVASRTRELAIRSALGARPTRLLAGVVGEGLVISLTAITVGAALSWGLTRVFGSMLFSASSDNGASLVTAAAILVTLSAAASFIPAWRAARVEPVRVLRRD